MKLLRISTITTALVLPLVSLAQGGFGEEEVVVIGQRSSSSFRGMVEKLVSFIDGSVIPLLFALAFVAILFGTLRYFFFEGEENLQKGRQFLLWGGISFVLMFVVWGVVRLLVEALKV